jgi:hypothetical protein
MTTQAPARTSGAVTGRGHVARRIAVTGLAAAALFVLYWRQSRLAPVSSDGASIALQARDMLHGNVLLHGWRLSDVSFYATELPQYMAIEALLGLGPWVVNVAAAVTYTLLVLLAGFLARGRGRGREGLTRALLAGGIILAPQLAETSTLLTGPDHTGTAVPVLAAWLIIDRRWPRGRCWAGPAIVCAVLTLATLSDPLVLVSGVAPLAAACILRLVRGVAAPRRYEAWLAGAAVAAGALGTAAPRVIAMLGGYRAVRYNTGTAGLGHLGRAAWVTVQEVLGLFGADVMTARPGIDLAFTVLRLTGVIMVGAAFVVAAARLLGPGDLVVPVLVLGIAFSLAAYLVSAYGQSLGTQREIAAVMPLGAALAGRVLAGPVLRVRPLRPLLAVAGAGYVLALVYGAAQGPATPANEPLAAWLSGHGLHDGLAGYWQANSTTLDSGGRVLVSFAGLDGGRLAAASWETRQQDYDPRRRDAAFVVAGGPMGVPGMAAAAERTFGPPLRVYHADGYTVLVWGSNLLWRLGPVGG